jgi:hypothetical protein
MPPLVGKFPLRPHSEAEAMRFRVITYHPKMGSREVGRVQLDDGPAIAGNWTDILDGH